VQPETNDLYSSRPYKVAFTVAVLLFLATLTAAVLVIIIANARDEGRESELEITLTAVFERVSQTETALAATPTSAPPLVYGRFPFALRGGSLVYSPAETCDQQLLTGYVFDQQGDPTDTFRITVWGDYITPQFLATGAAVQQGEGQWNLRLTDTANRRLWVQIMAAERYISAPVEVVFSAGDCEHNRVEIVFEQIAPLE
jgi:hypothetical protein